VKKIYLDNSDSNSLHTETNKRKGLPVFPPYNKLSPPREVPAISKWHHSVFFSTNSFKKEAAIEDPPSLEEFPSMLERSATLDFKQTEK